MSTPETPEPPPADAAGSTPPEPTPAAAATAATATTAPTDSNSLRGYHFNRLVRTPLTLWLIGIPALAALFYGLSRDPATGWIFPLVVIAIGVGIVFWIADSKAADDFFTVYAESRDLALGGRTNLPAATPLLRKGSKRYATRTLSGQIAPGLEGMLALYTYEERTSGSDGSQSTEYYSYTLGIADLPECVEHVPELYCQRKSGLRSLEKLEDAFRVNKRRVTLESEALADRYEIFVSKGQDDVWLRRLFSPLFIVWLTDSAPRKFAFELVAGILVAYVPGHEEDTGHLDGVAAATGAIAKRLRDEIAETSSS
ncbi:MAG: hypothetical protein JSS97_06260 [Actinobacteria bacterium]|nr:hypothetical protein [Actinomycetota bacterium]